MYLDSSLSCFTPCESGHVGRSATGISDLPKGRWATNEKDTTLANFAWLDGGPRSYYRVSDGPGLPGVPGSLENRVGAIESRLGVQASSRSSSYTNLRLEQLERQAEDARWNNPIILPSYGD